MKKLAGTLFRVFVSFFAMGLIAFFLRDKLSESFRILRHDVIGIYLLGAFACYGIALFLLSHRLQIIWKSQGIGLSYWRTVQISYAGLFFNFFLPSAVGGDLIKIFYASRKGHDKVAATASVMMDRLLGFLIIIGMGVTAIMLQRGTIHDPFIYGSLGIFAFVILAFSLLFFSRRINLRFRFLSRFLPSERILEIFKRIFRAFYQYRDKLPLLGYGLLVSLMIQCLIVLMYFFIGESLSVDLNPNIFFMIVPVTSIISMAPSMGGLGVREAGTVYLFSQYMPSERAVALTVLFDFVIYSFGLVGGLVFAFMDQGKKPSIKEMGDVRAN